MSLRVIAIISSWNYPIRDSSSQIIPAWRGERVVVDERFHPQCGALIEKFSSMLASKNLVTIVQGGGEVGQALIEAAPDKVLFTGSVATGRRVAEACARN